METMDGPQDLVKHKSSDLEDLDKYGDSGASTPTSTAAVETLETSVPLIQPSHKIARKHPRMERSLTNSNGPGTSSRSPEYNLYNNNNSSNNNHNLKNERLSPGTTDAVVRSRSVTPSGAPQPATSPNMFSDNRIFGEYIKSLAAKYQNANPNDGNAQLMKFLYSYYHSQRNGFGQLVDPRFKGLFGPTTAREGDLSCIPKKPEAVAPLPNPAANCAPLIDMFATNNLLAIYKTVKENEMQTFLKNHKKHDPSSPLDLSAGAPPALTGTGSKRYNRARANAHPYLVARRAQSESPKQQEDVTNWTVDDVCSFVSGIDICAEYAQMFRDQRIDGSGLPLLTEEHLTNKMSMKLGPALKLRSILAKKLGSCTLCLHCSHCHNSSSNSPERTSTPRNTPDSNGAS